MGVRAQPELEPTLLPDVRIVFIGLAIGLSGSLALTRFLGGQLYEVTSTDPQVFTLLSLAFGGLAIVAALVPARRALVDPVAALRPE